MSEPILDFSPVNPCPVCQSKPDTRLYGITLYVSCSKEGCKFDVDGFWISKTEWNKLTADSDVPEDKGQE